MRILSRKIWRAFPELDKYDDEVCQRYIRHAQRSNTLWKGVVQMIIAMLVGVVVWGGLMFNYDAIVYYLHSWYDIEIFDFVSGVVVDLFLAVRITGYIWFPVLCMLLVRDRWLNRCVRKQLSGIKCGACGYSLIGLTLIDDAPKPTVICPECGHDIVLGDMGLTPADIDPTLLTKS